MKIGINENQVLKNCEIVTGESGKISIDFTFATAGQEEESADSFAEDVYDENGMLVTGGAKGGTIKVWPLTAPDEKDASGAVKTTAVRVSEAIESTKELQNLFMSFAKFYKPINEIKFDRFAGLNITPQTTANLLNDEVMLAVTKNLANQFIDIVKPFDPSIKLRVLCVRQSATKAFPSFRRKFLGTYPITESMVIPLESSKLAFTKYEISKGLDSSAPSSTETDSTQEPEAPKDAASLFGAPSTSVE